MANEKFITLDNLKTFKTNCDTAYSTNVILISQPSTATNGTIDTKYQEFIGEPNSIILFNNEYYTIEDKEHTSGFVTYSHVGYENNEHLLKAITITTSTRAWTLNTSEVGRKLYLYGVELIENSKVTVIFNFYSSNGEINNENWYDELLRLYHSNPFDGFFVQGIVTDMINDKSSNITMFGLNETTLDIYTSAYDAINMNPNFVIEGPRNNPEISVRLSKVKV